LYVIINVINYNIGVDILNKQRKNILAIFLIATVIIITGVSLKCFNREKGTFYKLEMSKYYTGVPFKTIIVSRNNLSENQDNPQPYLNAEEKSTKIFNYLNEFNLTEVKSATMSDNLKGIDHMTFISKNSDTQIMISIFDEKCIRVQVFTDDTKNSHKEKTYNINNGSVDSKHLEELLK
jgi:hypothetical protein